ncbi:hypothetical protein FQA39_LY17194 [Lamprigera yunnana]|nr:hypothetical protein FQA39_LY17194 [Lamprigera yunnana]
MEWTNAKVCELIELYRDRPVLWDCRLKEYKDRNKKQDALQEIADTFGVDKQVVEKKIKNVVCHFLREIKGRETQDQVAGTSKDTPKRGDNENKRLPKKLPGGGPQKIQKTSATEEALSIMRDIQGRHTSGLDQFKTFGELVGLRIKDLPSSNAQKIVKHLISNILFEAEMGKYDHGNPLSGNYSQPFYPIPNYVQQPIPAPMPPNPNPYFEQPSFHGQTQSTSPQSAMSPTSSTHTVTDNDSIDNILMHL